MSQSGSPSQPSIISTKAAVMMAAASVTGTTTAAASHEAASAAVRASTATSRELTAAAASTPAPPTAAPSRTLSGVGRSPTAAHSPPAKTPASAEQATAMVHPSPRPRGPRPARRSMPWSASRPTVASWRAKPKRLRKKATSPRGNWEMSAQRISTRSTRCRSGPRSRVRARVSAS